MELTEKEQEVLDAITNAIDNVMDDMELDVEESARVMNKLREMLAE